MKLFIKRNYKLLIGLVIGLVLSTTGVIAATIFSGTDIQYTGNKVTGASNIQQAIDGLYDKAANSSTDCAKGYEKQNAGDHSYECKETGFFPTYYAYGNVTTSSTTDYTTLNKNVYVGLDTSGNKGVCINRGGEQQCFQSNSWDFEKEHMQQVFSDNNCSVNSGGVNCLASGFNCGVYSDGEVICLGLSDDSYCTVTSDGSVSCT